MMAGMSRPGRPALPAPEHVAIRSLRVAFRRAGAGPPLVLLHGGACDGRVWARQLEDLSAEFTVVAWDAPGCGWSSDPPEGFRMADYADCLAGFIDALGLGRPHVLGHSFGAGLALALCGRHPAVPQSLILAGAYAGWAGSLPADEVRRRLQATLDIADRSPGLPGPDAAADLPGLPASGPPSGGLEAIMSDSHPIGTRVMAVAFAEADLRPVLPLVEVPTLLLHGEADRRSPLEVAAAIHSSIPGSKLVVLPGLGHESYLEDPRGFNAEVRRFLLA